MNELPEIGCKYFLKNHGTCYLVFATYCPFSNDREIGWLFVPEKNKFYWWAIMPNDEFEKVEPTSQ